MGAKARDINIFEMRAATGSAHFAYQDSSVSQIFKQILNGERILCNIKMWSCADSLKGKTTHLRLPSARQKYSVLKAP